MDAWKNPRLLLVHLSTEPPQSATDMDRFLIGTDVGSAATLPDRIDEQIRTRDGIRCGKVGFNAETNNSSVLRIYRDSSPVITGDLAEVRRAIC